MLPAAMQRGDSSAWSQPASHGPAIIHLASSRLLSLAWPVLRYTPQQHALRESSDTGVPSACMLQVGSASGNSAAVWGAELRQNEGVLVAFDTWNGDLDMWLSESFRDVMGWQVCRHSTIS